MSKYKFLCAAAYVVAWSPNAAMAQSNVPLVIGQSPLSDVNCDYNVPGPPPTTVPPCAVNGTRTVSLTGTTRTAVSPAFDRITSTYDVAFDGTLAVDALPIVTGPGAVFPFGNSNLRDASVFFDGAGQTVQVATTYTGTAVQFVPTAAATPNQNVNRAAFSNYSNYNRVIIIFNSMYSF